ncbi:hypothetical protein [Pseudorhodoferax soli]|uniref:Uncharacterized protein n=1 Tax=Pseudorhodoferax soli TaxID=545864 RepID=A0A368XWM6_9BURK|nr:hypothetical protein [Pseudorhodoferax soli]RCW70434.1 hypothetical protein DES41_105377 [Pseudorhodoferax soli]
MANDRLILLQPGFSRSASFRERQSGARRVCGTTGRLAAARPE